MKRPRVLLADDHRLLREAFAQLLAPSCEVVGTVADGRALLAAASERRPDLVVLDITMPLLNGLDAARQLQRNMPEPTGLLQQGLEQIAQHGEINSHLLGVAPAVHEARLFV